MSVICAPTIPEEDFTSLVNFELWICYSSSTSYVEYQAGGGKKLVDVVNQLTLERCHSFWFLDYGS